MVLQAQKCFLAPVGRGEPGNKKKFLEDLPQGLCPDWSSPLAGKYSEDWSVFLSAGFPDDGFSFCREGGAKEQCSRERVYVFRAFVLPGL